MPGSRFWVADDLVAFVSPDADLNTGEVLIGARNGESLDHLRRLPQTWETLILRGDGSQAARAGSVPLALGDSNARSADGRREGVTLDSGMKVVVGKWRIERVARSTRRGRRLT